MKRILSSLLVLTFLFAALPSTAAAEGTSASYLVLSKGKKLPKGLTKQIERLGGEIDREFEEVGIAVVRSNQKNFKAKAEKLKGVRSVLPNVSLQWIDPVENVAVGEFSNPPSSGEDDFLFDLQWGHDAVDAPEAWNAGLRGNGARVAVLDDGIDSDHPDLAPNLNAGLSTSFVPGETFEYSIPGDVFSHGTHTSGTVAAADNGYGTIGVAPEAELVMVKVLSSFTGSGSFSGVISGILYAADIDADVINMSLGAAIPRHGYYDEELEEWVGADEVAELTTALGRATNYAHQQGTTIIASAGNAANDGDKDKDLLHLPSDSPHVISISATGPRGWATDPENISLDTPASYTNYGQSVIDFAAPGGDFVYPGSESCTVVLTQPCWVFDLVFSTGSAGSWYWSAGTSMSAPHVSGIAALIIGENGGDMKPAQVEAQLRKLADDLGKPGKDDFYGLGRVDAFNGND